MRYVLGFGSLALTLLTSLGCQNFKECSSNMDCPLASDGAKLYCTPDNICARGTPAAGLCTETYPPNSPSSAIVVGALVQVVSGSDLLRLQSYKLAVDEINKSRTGEAPIALRVCEIGATADDPLKSMEYLARQLGAVAVVGPSSSSRVALIKDEVIRSGIPLMSPSATSPEISAYGTADGPVNGLFYRVAPSDALQGPVMARQVPAGSKVAVLNVDDTYGTGLASTFISAFGVPALKLTYSEPAGTMKDPTTALNAANQIIAAKPAYVVAITNNYSEIVVQALVKLSTTAPAAQIIMSDGAKSPAVLNLIGAASTTAPFIYTAVEMNTHLGRTTGTAPTVDNMNQTGTGAYQNFKVNFQSKWGTDPTSSIYSAYGYDAMYAVGLAIGAAGSNVTPARVSEMLSHLDQVDAATMRCQATGAPGMGNQVVVGQSNYLAGKAKLAGGRGLVLQGASGTICFNAHGDRVSGLYEKWGFDTTNKAFTSTPAM
jgi:ABC-type branched-subunit amino acid transport system substrate-binding protein